MYYTYLFYQLLYYYWLYYYHLPPQHLLRVLPTRPPLPKPLSSEPQRPKVRGSPPPQIRLQVRRQRANVSNWCYAQQVRPHKSTEVRAQIWTEIRAQLVGGQYSALSAQQKPDGDRKRPSHDGLGKHLNLDDTDAVKLGRKCNWAPSARFNSVTFLLINANGKFKRVFYISFIKWNLVKGAL